MDFEWNENKAEGNLKKHDVSFREAATVFGDPLAITFNDPDHSIGERRLLTFGRTVTDKLIIVSHAELEDTIRIISARPMTKQERKIYEQP